MTGLADRVDGATVGTSYRASRADSTPPCSTTDPEVFFPKAQSRTPLKALSGEDSETTALRICATCPLWEQVQCLRDTLNTGSANQDGVVGGLTKCQRRYLLTSPANSADPALIAQVAKQLNVSLDHATALLSTAVTT